MKTSSPQQVDQALCVTAQQVQPEDMPALAAAGIRRSAAFYRMGKDQA